MSSVARIVSALMLVLAFTGLPLASVLCDAVCPPAQAEASAPSEARTPRLQPIHGVTACHDAGTDEKPAPRETSSRTGAAAAAGAYHATTGHACDHPVLANVPSPSAGIRVFPAPVPDAVSFAVLHPRATRVPAAVVSRDRAPGASITGAFSPVLRI